MLTMAMRFKVLLVDDSRPFLKAAERFLSGLSNVLSVATAQSGADALRAVMLDRPHVVLMDLNMPGMNGFEALRCIKASDPGIHIIVVSLHDTADFRSAALQAGADGYVTKDKFAMELPAAIAACEAGGDTRPCPAV
jgi:DNA-binding NarL/FixJ family response regulator